MRHAAAFRITWTGVGEFRLFKPAVMSINESIDTKVGSDVLFYIKGLVGGSQRDSSRVEMLDPTSLCMVLPRHFKEGFQLT